MKTPIVALLVAAAFASACPASSTRDVWRPFSDSSPWNLRIASDAPTDPDSTHLIAGLAARGAWFINIKDWSISLSFVAALICALPAR